jgi:hypothetical protein
VLTLKFMIMEPEYGSYKSGNLLSEIWKYFSQRPDSSRSLAILLGVAVFMYLRGPNLEAHSLSLCITEVKSLGNFTSILLYVAWGHFT